jgi:hypothetical protein
MKRTITKWIGIAAMAGAITFSLMQVRVPVARANGCPANPFPNCMCEFLYSVSAESGWTTTTCVYNCACGSPGGGDFFLIEKEYVY